MKTILLSIIVPAYNMENYLERSLSSLLVDESLMRRFEVLVINDGSKDRTSEIAHDFEARYPDTFRVIDKENGHYGSCVNRGLAEAKGTFVKVLDADDAFKKDVFSSYLVFLAKNFTAAESDVILSDSAIVDESDQVRRWVRYSQKRGDLSVEDLTYSDIYNWFIHSLTYRTSFLREISYRQTEGLAYTDNEWSIIPMAFVQRITYFDEGLYLYTVGREDQSVNERVHAKNLWMEAKIFENVLIYLNGQRNKIKPSNKKFLSDKLLIVITHLYQLYLVTYKPFRIPLQPLAYFDEVLKTQSPELYDKTESYATRICGIKFYPVKNWRHRHRLLAGIQAVLYCLADSINKFRNRR